MTSFNPLQSGRCVWIGGFITEALAMEVLIPFSRVVAFGQPYLLLSLKFVVQHILLEIPLSAEVSLKVRKCTLFQKIQLHSFDNVTSKNPCFTRIVFKKSSQNYLTFFSKSQISTFWFFLSFKMPILAVLKLNGN